MACRDSGQLCRQALPYLPPWEIPRAQVNVTVVTQAMDTASAQLHQESGTLRMPGSSKHMAGLFESTVTGNSRIAASRLRFRKPSLKKEKGMEPQGLLCLLQEVEVRQQVCKLLHRVG